MKRLNKNRLAFVASLDLDSKFTLNWVMNKWTKYETGIHKSVRSCGPRYTIDRYKESYLFLRNLSLELPAQPILWCKADSKGIPKPLWPLRSLIKGNRDAQRVALTIARSYELITLPIDYCPSSIQEPPSYGVEFKETTKDFKIFLEEFTSTNPWYLGSLHRRDSLEPRVFTTVSYGPNGPALSSAHLDARAVVTDPTIYSSIKKLNNALGQN